MELLRTLRLHVCMLCVCGAAGRGRERVSCPECGRRYSNLSNLRQHVRLIHRSQPVACPQCARCFKTPLYLRRHTLSQHTPRAQPNPTFKPQFHPQSNLNPNPDNPRPNPNIPGLPPLKKMCRLPVMTLDGTSSENSSVLKCINGKTNNFNIANGDMLSCDSAEEDMIRMEGDMIKLEEDLKMEEVILSDI